MKTLLGRILTLVLALQAGTALAITYRIEPGVNAQQELQGALGAMGHGDTIEFAAGIYHLTTPIIIDRLNRITIKGAGRDATILSFAGSGSPDGLLLTGMDGIRVQDLTVIDTPGFAITVSKSKHVELLRLRTMWSSADGSTNLEDPASLEPICIPNLAQPGTPDSSRRKYGQLEPLRQEHDKIRPDYEHFIPAGTPLEVLRNPSRAASYTVSAPYIARSTNGAYAIYPVQSEHILIDDVQSFGAADAGIYVGQSNHVIVRNSLARYNVAGYEIENTDHADMHDNIAECNTAGFFMFDLPGLRQYGEETRVFNNIARYNNLHNFAVPGVVADAPAGVGLLALGYDKMQIYNNTFEHNRTAGIVAASHELLAGGLTKESDLRMDLYPEAMYIYENTFFNNGYFPQEPEVDVILGRDGEPAFDDSHSSLLPLLIMIKGLHPQSMADAAQAGTVAGPRGGHIVWDGMLDDQPWSRNVSSDTEVLDIAKNGICGYPDFDSHVKRLPQGASYQRDEFGKPDYQYHPELHCRYNAYKFQHWNDGSGFPNGSWIGAEDLPAGAVPEKFTRAHPRFSICIAENNTFDGVTPPLVNFKDTDPTSPASYDLTPHRCELPLLGDPGLEPFEAAPGGTGGSVDPAEMARICSQDTGDRINYEALDYNCPKLSDYNLFGDQTNPRDGSARGGIRYDLTTPLFSDYAKKYRIVFVPASGSSVGDVNPGKGKGQGKSQAGGQGKGKGTPGGPNAQSTDESITGRKAGWRTGSVSEPNVTLDFPVGTVIAKTFSFPNGDGEKIIETRLLIHRGVEGDSLWKGLPYVWREDMSDADVAFAGKQNISATWNYADRDTGKNLSGSTSGYLVPSAGQCVECHSNQDHIPGASPIGTKVRLLNMPSPVTGQNQLQDWINAGILEAPEQPLLINAGIATNAPRLPRYGVAGDTYHHIGENYTKYAGNGADLEARARAWLETNCAHCHNNKGRAGSTSLFLDVFRETDLQYGVCKKPPAGGSGLGGFEVDIKPAKASESIIPFRMANTKAGEMMPPIGRSVAHQESVDIVNQWINQVVNENYPNGKVCK